MYHDNNLLFKKLLNTLPNKISKLKFKKMMCNIIIKILILFYDFWKTQIHNNLDGIEKALF